MPRITEDLVRRRAEHNNGEITTLEELSLHQQELERIEHLDKWCRDLKILYLQNNLIPKIENVGRLKQLQYLNLALNNIEKIENLEACEFLEKLDLTVNFVGDLLSVERLKQNHHLRELYLTGNPCTDYEGYREFVVASLPQLRWLDGREVSKSERILAVQRCSELRPKIITQQREYEAKREREKREHEQKSQKSRRKEPGFDGRWYTDPNAHLTHDRNSNGADPGERTGSCSSPEEGQLSNGEKDDREEERFWNEPVSYTPESRTEMHNYMAEKMKDKNKDPDTKGPDPPKRVRRLEKDGRMLNVNEGRYDFHLEDDEESNQYTLEVACPRFMDTSLIDCDVHPTYVRVTIKGKVLQLVLQDEVSPDRSSVKRSQTTGKLLISMSKVKQIVKPRVSPASTRLVPSGQPLVPHSEKRYEGESSPPLLEVDPAISKKVDFCNIVPEPGGYKPTPRSSATEEPSEEFVDDSDVPPLI